MTTDYRTALAADADRRRAVRDLRLSVPCPHPRCPAGVGEECRTPNGWAAYHKARERAVNGAPEPKPRKPRLTDAQAQRIEIAAEYGRLGAPGQYAIYGGDAADRAVADALLRHGWMELVATDDHGNRTLRLTADGWRQYWHNRLVIRRLPEERHDSTCPCTEKEEPRP